MAENIVFSQYPTLMLCETGEILAQILALTVQEMTGEISGLRSDRIWNEGSVLWHDPKACSP
ncbi:MULTISPECIES: hypothetical protein [Leptolyngbya]|uniref:hypothetical protein n=1 Tax=Leptolyngbya TaxID=47251 RepID=UPI0011818746|nr:MULTISPECIES: hypothetical protein [Leptolyngbya]MBD2371344.1 hypothetical protein [Leptolyngbya sp. FACHB-161]MBD2377840.1 hypothetical protein [Leptolyngbya sp. FACHB-238]MBD2402277.1 hypothetical protein [Leptolyngbya sp. FACHB-239]MBD2408770.1 hypothetical protein [Leptolyngbya sp. FACHB-402]ULP33825.1 hypothetical protein MCP04_32140 [Leptolyngbya boryana IU 594]